MRFIYTSIFLAIACLGWAQVVWTEPAFPSQNDDITLFFDATMGNGGLEGFTDDVYAHMGLITNLSSSPTDWKYVQGVWGTEDDNVLMTRVSEDLYSKTYNISDFHGLPAGESVTHLAFVFRSGNGQDSGRAADGSDIFLEVFPPNTGIQAIVNSPQPNSIIFEGETIDVDIDINIEARVVVSDNGQEIFDESTDKIEFTIIGEDLGQHVLEIIIDDGSQVVVITRSYLVIPKDDIREARPDWIARNGLSYRSDGSGYGFSLTAPGKEHVFLLCPANNFTADVNYQMRKVPEGDRFWIDLPAGDFSGSRNLYQYLVDGEIIIADPYSKVVLDPWNDAGVDASIMSEFPDYPVENTSGFVSYFELENRSYPWQILNFEKPEKERLVIYELMMRDFLGDHSYSSLLDTIPYLARLGINAIQLMPVNEFEGNNSWGYNPSFHNAIDKYYGTEEQLQQVVDVCHQNGIAVILDVVYNHAFSQSPLCQLYWDAANFRPTDGNPWLNVTARHPFNVGYDFNHESEYTKEWVKTVLSRLITDLNIDGFRFDLSKGFTQFNSGNNASLSSRFDQSRIDILSDYADHVWSFDEDLYVIMEHFADFSEERELAQRGMMLWSNTTFQYSEAAMGYVSDLTGSSYKSRGFPSPAIIAYMESHDEERMGYKINTWGNSSPSYNTKEPWTFADRIVASSAVYFSIPGPKMVWQFGELGYAESINRCENGTINNNCRLSPKPIGWPLADEQHRQSLLDRLKAIIYLRNTQDVFHTSNFGLRDDDYYKRIQLNGSDMNVVTIANFDVHAMTVSPEFQHTGEWYDYMSGEQLTVTDVNMLLELKPGEFRIYTSREIVPPGGFFTAVDDLGIEEINIFPNPTRAGGTVLLNIDPKSKIAVYNQMGQLVPINQIHVGEQVRLELPNTIPTGTYFVFSETTEGRLIAKISIIN